MKMKIQNRYDSFTRAVCASAVMLVAAGMSAQAQYNYITLSVPGEDGTYAQGISGNDIVGYYMTGGGSYYGFLYNGSSYITLSVPGAEEIGAGSGTYAEGVSGNDIVGYYDPLEGYNIEGFFYNGSSYTTLIAPGAIETYAQGISGNDIVGYYFNDSGDEYGFLYNINRQTYTTLPFAAVGIFGGIVVGGNLVYNINSQTYTTLSVPGAVETAADSISGNDIVGTYYNSSGTEGTFLYNGSSYTTLNLPGAAYGISGNDIVGIYNSGGDFSDVEGFLATPVPEPTSLALAALGALLLWHRKR